MVVVFVAGSKVSLVLNSLYDHIILITLREPEFAYVTNFG
jgi:hypothetical protein